MLQALVFPFRKGWKFSKATCPRSVRRRRHFLMAIVGHRATVRRQKKQRIKMAEDGFDLLLSDIHSRDGMRARRPLLCGDRIISRDTEEKGAA